MPLVANFDEERGLTNRQTTKTIVDYVAQDLGSRLMVDQGVADDPNYRTEANRSEVLSRSSLDA
ncbi:MAG: hypothetical protein O3A00_01410 [Planctomycetota bacterium]|nr:hypothetical protein [Planctomycetota bacterium]